MGIILSMLPPAASTAIWPVDCTNSTLDKAPTTKATPVMNRMNTPPNSTPRFRERSEDTVMKRTANWGWASTPMPTP